MRNQRRGHLLRKYRTSDRLSAYEAIWATVRRIPKGKVATYGTIARLSGFLRHARLVGYALHRLPSNMDVPWHRVVNSQARISLRGENGRTQHRLLEEEGVRFSDGKIDVARFGWRVRKNRNPSG